MIAKPIEVRTLKKFKIWVRYSDNVSGEIDLSHLVGQGVFKEWDKENFFNNVYIDAETNAIAWNEKIELCPNTLYLRLVGKSFNEWIKEKQVHAPD